MKILIVTQKIDEKDNVLGFFHAWVNKLAGKADRLYIVTLEKGETRLANNIEVYSMGKEKGHSRFRMFFKFQSVVASLLLNRKVDCTFIHMCPEYALLTFPYAKLMKIPVVMWYAHGSVNIKLRIAHFLADQIVTSSKEGFRLKSNKVVIVGQGIDVDKFKTQSSKRETQDNKKKIILSVGRISSIKGYETLIESADILINQKQIKDIEFQIVGGASLKSQKRYADILRNMIRDYKLENYVKLIGPAPYTEIHKYYQNCSLFVNTSSTGSLDKVVLEAMACEKVILTCNEAFKNALNSYSEMLMFRKGNSDELAEKVSSLLQMDGKLGEELGQNLRNIVIQKHSLNRFIDRLEGIFHELFKKREYHR